MHNAERDLYYNFSLFVLKRNQRLHLFDKQRITLGTRLSEYFINETVKDKIFVSHILVQLN